MVYRPALFSENIGFFSTLIALECICYGISFSKFGKETCTHAISAKFYGLSLFAAMISLLAFGSGGSAVKIALIMGWIANLDVILIILLLPAWASDIPSFFHALTIRQGKPIKRYRIFN